MRIRALHAVALAAAAAAAVVVPASPAVAAKGAAVIGEHCVAHVIDQRADGELIIDEPDCYARFSDAMASIGVDTDAAGPPELSRTELAAASTFTIGQHFDANNWAGSSFTVEGVDCNYGYLNLPLSWRNRVSSTLNGCPRIRHFINLNVSGTYEDTVGMGSALTYNDNLTDSIQYRAV